MRQSPRAVHHVVARAALTLLVAACSGSDAGPAAVTPPTPNATVVTWTPCPAPAAAPIWAAQQDGSGAWAAVAPSSGSYRFSFQSSKGAIAYVTGSAGSYNTYVLYGTTADLLAFASSTCYSALRNVTGSIATLGVGEQAEVSVGWNSTFATGPGSKSVTVSAQNAEMDLLAVLHRVGTPAARAVIRRDIPSSVMTFDPIDFASAEAFDTERPSLTITGANGEAVTFAQWYRGTNGSRNALHYGNASVTLPTSYAAIPATRQRPSDLHEGWAFTSVTQSSGVIRGRTVTAYRHDPVALTVALPAIPSSDPTVSVASTAPFVRLRALLAVPSGAKSIELFYSRTDGAGSTSARVDATVDFLAAAAADLTVPNLTSVAGFQSAYLPQATGPISWGMYSYSWTGSHAGFFGRPLEATQSTYVSWRSTVTP